MFLFPANLILHLSTYVLNYYIDLTNYIFYDYYFYIVIGAPDPPQNFSVIDQTDHSITVQWVAGYDGGHEQTFYVVYRQHGTDKWTTMTVSKSIKAKPNQLLQSEISGLQHSTTYEIKMFAENQQNKSAETMTKTGLTDTKAAGMFKRLTLIYTVYHT